MRSLALIVVLALVSAGLMGGRTEAGRFALTTIVPYAAFLLLLAGILLARLALGLVPVPFHIPSYLRTAALPTTGFARRKSTILPLRGVLSGRMAGESLLFRSLFRNNKARLEKRRLILGESGFLWLRRTGVSLGAAADTAASSAPLH